jgi:hypothetical protein
MTRKLRFPRPQGRSRSAARGVALAVAIAAGLAAAPTRAELAVSHEQVEGGERTTLQMTVTPAPQPKAALKNTLSLAEIDRKTGNAVPFYYRAMLSWPRTIEGIRSKYGDDYDKWIDVDNPLSKLPLNKASAAVQELEPAIMVNLREASRRSESDWSWQIQTLPGLQSISFLLPEMQLSRDISSALLLRTRVAIGERRYEDAIEELRINYQLARDMAAEPILICSLVGIAEANLSNRGVLELMAAKDSPNLYWALAELPRPMADLRRAARSELTWGFNIFAFLRDAEKVEHSPQEWGRLWGETISQISMISGDTQPQWNQLGGQIAATGAGLATYPAAKQRLLDAGLDKAKVEAMPVGQVMAVDAGREYHALADELVKWMYVPYTVMRQRERPNPFPEHGGNKIQSFSRGFGYLMGSLLLPSLENARATAVRFEWQLNAMMAVEAIRMHAAETGKLPAKLDDVKIVPVPENPATGQPYAYHVDGETAVIDLPFSDGFRNVAWRFEIKLAK